MTHYICLGVCGTVSVKPDVCQDELCYMHGKSLTLCECTDGKHLAVIEAHRKEGKEEGTGERPLL